MDTAYNPFGKDIEALETADLAALRSVEEGWFVEYKRESVPADSIAKSVSALANTYGGWVFYGVTEASKKNPAAGDFPGVPAEEVDKLRQRLRQGLGSSVKPVPFFRDIVLWGPCPELGLLEDRAVVCVHVPWSHRAPHLHSSGRVYRRVGAGSDPVPETDRVLLEDLWKRSNELNAHYSEWLQADPEFRPDEASEPYLRLLLVPDLWRTYKPWTGEEVEQFRALLNNEGGEARIPFTWVHTSPTGFIARQTLNNDPSRHVLAWKFWRSLRSEILIPLHYINARSVAELEDALDGYAYGERFCDLLEKSRFRQVKAILLNHLLGLLVGVVEAKQRILQGFGWNHGYHFKARLLNVGRTVPFLDTEKFLSASENHGIPVCMSNQLTCLPGQKAEDFFEVKATLEGENPSFTPVRQALQLLIPIATGLGLPLEVMSDIDGLNEATTRWERIQNSLR